MKTPPKGGVFCSNRRDPLRVTRDGRLLALLLFPLPFLLELYPLSFRILGVDCPLSHPDLALRRLIQGSTIRRIAAIEIRREQWTASSQEAKNHCSSDDVHHGVYLRGVYRRIHSSPSRRIVLCDKSQQHQELCRLTATAHAGMRPTDGARIRR